MNEIAFKNCILAMKLSGFLILVTCLQVSANGIGQNITLSLKQAPLRKVFTEIIRQSGTTIIYNQASIKDAKPVTTEINNATPKQVLDICLKGQPFFYVEEDGYIIVKSTSSAGENLMGARPSLFTTVPPITVRGRIVNERGEPVVASIVIKGTNRGTSSSTDGYFELANIDENATLIISAANIESREIKVASRVNVGNVGVITKLDNMNEVVINKGYYTEKQRFTTGSVSTVNGEEIRRQPVSNVLQALEGKAPGLFIAQSSGITGSQMSIQIRGQESISSGKLPLFVIDGVPFVETPINTLGGSTWAPSEGAASLMDPLNSINPSDIESISVLKDADATSIYGSRAANGVILITTRKGKSGDARFEVQAYTGGGRVGRKLKLLNLQQYLLMRNTAFANDALTPDISSAPDLTVWDTTKSSDFQDQFIGNTAKQTDVTATFSGGEQRFHYRFSNTLRNETTVYPGDFGYRRWSSHLSVDNQSANGKFFVSVTAMYTKEKNDLGMGDMTAAAVTLPPNYPLYTNDGKLNWSGGFSNPLSNLLQTFDFASENLLANTTLRYTILPGLAAKVSLGYNKISQDRKALTPASATNPADNLPNSASYSSNYVETYIVEPQLDYQKTIGRGRLNVTAGGTWQTSEYAQPYTITARGFSSEQLMSSWAAASEITYKSSSYTDYKYASAFGRLNYIWNDKYLFNATARRDGSSRFGPNHQWGNFGSVGAGWIFSQESFIMENLPWLSFGKLRASYGSTGNDNIPDYGYLATYMTWFYPYVNTGIVPARSANPDYSWEANRKVEAALETGFFHDRILFTAAWFSSRTDNQLVSAPLSPQSGFSSYQANLPALLQSSGWEFNLITNNIRSKDLSWTSTINLTVPRNKLISFPGLKKTAFAYVYVEGQPINNYFGYHYTGLKDGIATVEDVNKDGSIDPGLAATNIGDYLILESSTPKYYGGFSNSLRWKGFQLDILIQFVNQIKAGIRQIETLRQPGAMNNQDADILNQGFRLSTLYGSEATNAYVNFYQRSDASYSNASFIRLKNVSLSYELPAKWTKAVHMRGAGAFVRGQNLATITNYLGLDPETAGLTLPPLRQIIAGLNFSF